MCRMSATPRERPTAVFDSGVRGLTVPHALLVALAEHLLALDAKLLVVACGSATAAALPLLHERLTGSDAEVLGVIEPAAELAVEATRSGRVGLLATPATVASGAFVRAIAAGDP